MAATQAEPQQNDVNRDIVHQDQPQLSVNNSFQNGTDNGNCRGVIGADVISNKGKKPVQNNISLDMSQYRQETGPPINNSEQNVNSSEDSSGKIGNSDKSFPHNSEQSASEVNFGKGPPDGQNMQGYGIPFPQRGSYMHPDTGNPMHLPGGESIHHQTNSYGHFTPAMRHSYPGAKPLPVPTRPPSGGPITSSGFPSHSPQQRFNIGQSISPPTGPTPTLNQLLQSSNSVHRYQNSYGDYGMPKSGEQPQGSMPYNQNWPPPRGPMGPYPPPQQPGPGYRNQPASAASRGYAGSPGGGPYPPPPSASPSQQYPPQPYRHPYQMPPGGGGGANNGSSFPTSGGGVSGTQDSRSSWSPGPQSSGPQQTQQEPPSPSTHPHQAYQTPRGSEQSPTPNTHAPEPGDLTGQNSNDSSSGGGPAPGTPNSGGMRPTPSPTGSTGSRSMSPAVGQQNISMPPRPSSGQSDSGNGPTSRMSHSPMPNQGGGGYPGQGPGGGVAPPHIHNYKMSAHQLPHPPQSQQVPPYSSQPQQHPQYPQQGNYAVRGAAPGMGMGYGQGYGGQGPPPPSQYPPPRPMPNHVQYPPSPYQHKVGYGGNMPPSPGSYNSHGGGAMGPPPSHHPGMPPPPPPTSTPTHEIHDSAITTTPPASAMTAVSQSASGGSGGSGSVTSIVTTGPDGATLDEASQHSTLSNVSAASGDDGNITPSKRVKDGVSGMMGGYHSHPTTPLSTAPSPGAASLNSMHEEYPPDHSPTWSRTPASPKQHDSLGKLYDMDESHERRLWLDKLLHYMEERGTPISTCPTISKNPLDLFRLYLYVKERGGFMEVTKNKIWKDIAGLLGIGASSSAAYTLRKHYTKNLLPFECHFDRGGIDPQPIINQVEATSKKKGAKGAAPVPSPGSSNSQDSFQGPGSGGTSMDGYSNYAAYSQDYNSQQSRPPSQSSQGMPSSGPGGYQSQGGGYGQYGGDGYNQQYPASQYPPSRPLYPPYGPDAATERGYNQPNNNNASNNSGPAPTVPGSGPNNQGGPPGPPPANQQSQQGQPQPQANQSQQQQQQQPQQQQPQQQQANQQQDYGRYPGMGGGYPPPRGYPPPGGGASPSGGTAPTGQYTGEYYRPTADGYYPPPTGSAKTMPPPAQQPRRHPDFLKDAPPQPPYPPYSQQRPNMYPGWSNNNNNNYPRGQYPPTAAGNPGAQQWGAQGAARPGVPPPNHQPNSPQWQPPYQAAQGQQGWGMGTPGVNQNPNLRPQIGPPRPGFRPDAKQYCQGPPHPGVKGLGPGFGPGAGPPVKREFVFPLDSVEATTAVQYKRRRLAKADVAPIEAWRIMMSLKSGLLAETTWALDVLNILLFDDSTIAYFGLLHLPGLMDILLEHMKRALSDMLEPSENKSDEQGIKPEDLGAVVTPPVPEERKALLKCGDYTYRSRKGNAVTIDPENEDIFILDGRRSWDSDDIVDDGDQDSRYIISCFRAEFGKIPFVRMLSGPCIEKKAELKEEPKLEAPQQVIEEKKPERKPPERLTRKKTKSLSDVLSRIKKDVVPEQSEEPTKQEIKEEQKEEPVVVRPPQDLMEIIVKNEKDEDKLSCKIRDPAGTLKRRRISDYEDECYTRDEASLYLVTETQDAVARRCVCISTILRNLTFVPGNELEFAKSGTFLGLLGKLLLLHHEHPPRAAKQRNYDREEDTDFTDSCSSLQADSDWWWEFLHHLRENALVSIANIAGYVDLGLYPEDISRPILDGLLHWAVCPAAQGQDPFPTVSPTSSLSPQRLALEALCKLSVTDSNVDLVIATPPYCRLERLAAVLTRLLCRSEEQVLREFGVNLLYYLGAADSGMARTIALQPACVSQLVAFIEQAEASALGVANQHGLSALRDNPDCMGTSLDMLRRAARTLLHLSQHPENRPLFLQQEQRLLALVMSQILDQQVASIISMVLFHVSRSQSPYISPELSS